MTVRQVIKESFVTWKRSHDWQLVGFDPATLVVRFKFGQHEFETTVQQMLMSISLREQMDAAAKGKEDAA